MCSVSLAGSGVLLAIRLGEVGGPLILLSCLVGEVDLDRRVLGDPGALLEGDWLEEVGPREVSVVPLLVRGGVPVMMKSTWSVLLLPSLPEVLLVPTSGLCSLSVFA